MSLFAFGAFDGTDSNTGVRYVEWFFSAGNRQWRYERRVGNGGWARHRCDTKYDLSWPRPKIQITNVEPRSSK